MTCVTDGLIVSKLKGNNGFEMRGIRVLTEQHNPHQESFAYAFLMLEEIDREIPEIER